MADLRNPAADTAAMPAPLDLAALAPQPEPEPLFSPAPAAPESPPEATLQSEPAAAATAAVPPPPAPRPAMARPIDPPRPVTLAAAGADPPPAADAAAGDGSRVQVGAMRTAEAAQREWNRLRSLHPDLFAGIAPAVVRTQLARRNQVVWRLQTLPLPDRDSAGRLCNSLKQRRVDCLVVQG